MADFSQLIADVQAVIRENGRQLITGPVLQSTLIEIINSINADKQDPLNIVDALIAGSTDPVTSGAVEAAVSGLGIDLADEVNARVAADALLVPKADIVQTLGTATDKVPSVDLLRSQVALLHTAIGEKWTRPTVVSFDDALSEEPIATYNGVDYYSQMDLFNAIVAQGQGGVAADTSVLAALGITPELITDANGASSAGLIIEQKQLEMLWRSLFVKSENEWDGYDGDYYVFKDGEYRLSFHVERPEGQPETITGHFSRDEELHRSDIKQSTGTSISSVMSQKAVTDALATKADKDTDAVEGNLAQFDANGNPVDAGEKLGDFAKKDGTYPDLTAGAVLGAPVPAEFAYRGAPYGGSAVVDTVLGNSVKWNQLLKQKASQVVGNGMNCSYSNGILRLYCDNVTFAGGGRTTNLVDDNPEIIAGHRYIFYAPSHTAITWLFTKYGSSGEMMAPTPNSLFDAPYGYKVIVGFNIATGTFTIDVSAPFKLIDLTTIFGSGNEPSTVAEFEAWMAQQGFAGLTDYNPGQVLGNAAKNLKTAGFNLWDEEIVTGGYYDNTGTWQPLAVLSDKNGIPVFPNTNYYIHQGSNAGIAVTFWDNAGNFISRSSGVNNTVITTPANCYLLHFNCTAAYGTTYHHDICINISGPRNGQYEPYVGAIDTIALNLSTLTGIPEGGGSSEVVFPLGLQSIGGVSDWGKGSEAMRKFKVVDLGAKNYTKSGILFSSDLADAKRPTSSTGMPLAICARFNANTWQQANDGDFLIAYTGSGAADNAILQIAASAYASVADFKAAMQGVYLVYELATPVKFTLDQPLPALYETAEGGPEYIEGPAGTAPTTAPFAGEIRYSQPQADANGLAVAILDALKAASKILSYTFGIDPETSKPAITIS